jgi:preprotein translocase subunit SecD
MMINFVRFNIYLAAALGLILATGCASSKSKEKKEATTIELHLEANQDGTPQNAPVPVYRAKPMYVNVEKDAFLDGGYLEKARVVDQLGGFVIELKFDWEGIRILDGVTTDNHNRRVAVFAKFGKDPRWLGAPVIRRRISDGVLSFTPDATREEADRIVRGLNNLAVELKKRDKL